MILLLCVLKLLLLLIDIDWPLPCWEACSQWPGMIIDPMMTIGSVIMTVEGRIIIGIIGEAVLCYWYYYSIVLPMIEIQYYWLMENG